MAAFPPHEESTAGKNPPWARRTNTLHDSVPSSLLDSDPREDQPHFQGGMHPHIQEI